MVNEFPKVLIVGTVPYNKKSTSRAFESYFHGWDRERLAQVFSNTRTPVKGHCGSLYQITDQRLVKRRFDKRIKVGKRYEYEELPDEWLDNDLELGSSVFGKLYAFGSRSSHITHLMRKFVWRERFWHTDDLDAWLDGFKPDCVFLAFSNDYFILEIALYVAEKYDIPIVSAIGDDYYFEERKTLSPLYWLYKRTYRSLVRRVFEHGGSAVYIGNKIRDKYNSAFGLRGETVYLTSEADRRPFRPIDVECPVIRYFGNIRLGRNQSLLELGKVLGRVNSNYRLEVYSNETDQKQYQMLVDEPSVDFMGSVPYKTVLDKTLESDVLVVVEGFDKRDVDITRYSLSTKVADALASGVMVVGYGSSECGAIEYLAETGCCCVANSAVDLQGMMERLFGDVELQRRLYKASGEVVRMNHTLENSNAVFRGVVERAIEGYVRHE